MDVAELLKASAAWLAERGVDSPRLDAELLLGEVLGLDRLHLYTSFDRPVAAAERDRFRELLRRRGRREPLAYVLGRKEFWSRDFAVDARVLVPRADTETLVEAALGLLGPAPPEGAVVLDYGTGSGCLAVTLAAERPGLRVLALDLAGDALAVARGNAERHGVADRVGYVRGDGLGALPERFRGALLGIVANPPYLAESERAGLMPEVRDHEPAAALFPGPDALLHYRRLARDAGACLREDGGWLAVEVGATQAGEVAGILAAAGGWQHVGTRLDLGSRQRVVTARKNRSRCPDPGPDPEQAVAVRPRGVRA